MTSNVSNVDRILRFLLAGILLYSGLNLYPETTLGVGLEIVSGLLALSALIGFCGIYRLLGISTRNPNNRPQA